MSRTRVVVIGAGVIGAACARELRAAGFDVLILERARPAGGTTSHGEGNILVSDNAPAPQLQLAQLSLGLWPHLVTDAAEYDPKGGIVVATTEAGAHALTAFAAAQAAVGVRTSVLSTAEVAAAEPALTHDVTAGVHYPEDAQV